MLSVGFLGFCEVIEFLEKALEKQKKQELAEFLRMQMNEKAKNANPNEDRKAKLVAQMENQQFDYFGR